MPSHDILIDAIKKIAGFMNIEPRIEVHQESQDGKGVFISVYVDDNGRFLIGKNGQNLHAFEHIVRLLSTRSGLGDIAITLDVNDYRKSRAQHAVELARQALSRVRSTLKAEALSPMSAYERRVVHMELASHPDITTESIGEEPQRRVVIKPFTLE